jgi:hypothetical protein
MSEGEAGPQQPPALAETGRVKIPGARLSTSSMVALPPSNLARGATLFSPGGGDFSDTM